MISEAEEISNSILISLTIFIFPLFLKAIEFKSFEANLFYFFDLDHKNHVTFLYKKYIHVSSKMKKRSGELIIL